MTLILSCEISSLFQKKLKKLEECFTAYLLLEWKDIFRSLENVTEQ